MFYINIKTDRNSLEENRIQLEHLQIKNKKKDGTVRPPTSAVYDNRLKIQF